MSGNLDKYFELVEKSRNAVETPDQGIVRGRLKEVTRKIKKTGNLFSDPNADMDEVMSLITNLKEEQRELLAKIAESGDVDRTSVKKQIVDVRREILETKHAREWDKLVGFFSDNPVALTSLIHQTGYDQKDPVKILKTLPFRGRVSGPYGTRYHYIVELSDDSALEFSSVRKVILALDQYNKDFRSLALTFDALQRFVTRGISIHGVKIVKVLRTPKVD